MVVRQAVYRQPSGRGYAFIGAVTRENALSPTAAPTEMAEAGNLPALLTRVVGRDGVISRLAQQLARRRFLTIVGPGGIAKPLWRSPPSQTAYVYSTSKMLYPCSPL